MSEKGFWWVAVCSWRLRGGKVRHQHLGFEIIYDSNILPPQGTHSRLNIDIFPFSTKLPCRSIWHTNRYFVLHSYCRYLIFQVLVAILSGALWVPYLSTFPSTLLLATIATFTVSFIITKLGPVFEPVWSNEPNFALQLLPMAGDCHNLCPYILREGDSPMTHKSGRIWRWEDEAVASEKPNCTLSEKIILLI